MPEETKAKWNIKLIFAVIAAALGSGFQHGYHTGVINVPQKVLMTWENSSYKDRSGQYLDDKTLPVLWGTTTSIMNIGGTIGGLLVAIIAQKLGRKGGLLLNNVLVLIATICMGLAKTIKSFEIMIIGRFIIGINAGINAGLCPMYLSEISPVTLRGAIGTMYQLIITISILIAQCVGLAELLGNDELWPYLFVLPIIFAVFQVVTLLFCPESPIHLVSNKADIAKAEKALNFLRMSDNVAEEVAEIDADDKAAKALPKVTLKEMFKNRQLKIPLLIAVTIMLAQQFSGINAVIFYSTSTFEQAGLTPTDAKFATIGIGVVNVLMTVVSLYLVDIAGRKTLLLVGFGGMAIDTALLCVALNLASKHSAIPYVCIVFVFIYIILFASGAGSIPWFLVNEIFNQAARPTAVSLAVPTNWVANFVVTLLFPLLEGVIGPYVFLIFVVLDVVFFIFIWKVVPETKNKPIDDIIAQWQ